MFQIKYSIIVLLGILVCVNSQTVDQTLVPRAKGADIVEAVVKKIQRSGIFPHDQNILRRLAFVESRDGEDSKTYRANYFGGIWQLDEVLFNQTRNVASLNTFYQRINTTWNIQWNNVTWEDLTTPFHSGLGARLLLQRLTSSGFPIPGTISAQASYWRSNYNRETGTVAYFQEAVKRLESDGGVCEGMMDICIVLDGSASIGNASFIQAKGFVADLVGTFALTSTRVAFSLYSDIAVNIFNFSNTLDAAAMNRTIRSIGYPNLNTNTPDGLNMAVTFFNLSTPRPGVPKVVATFTDGVHNRGNLPEAVLGVRRANLTSFAVGIGSQINDNELHQIALGDPSRVLRVNNYEALSEFFYQMNKVTCEVPQEPEVGEEQNGTLSRNETRYFKFQIPTVGFTFRLSVTRGQIHGCYSFTEPTPNSAFYDGLLSRATFIQRLGSSQNPNTTSEVYIAIQGISDGGTDYKVGTLEGNHSNAWFLSPNPLIIIVSIVLIFVKF